MRPERARAAERSDIRPSRPHGGSRDTQGQPARDQSARANANVGPGSGRRGVSDARGAAAQTGRDAPPYRHI